jgi:CO dehydrogenase/acetyl-CoA synthase alpha subunit
MSSPFRYNKKERRRWRKGAREHAAIVEKFQSEPTKSCFIAASQKMAEVCTKIAAAKRRKKKSNPS